MASYSLLGSESVVQVLSPTVTNPVVYCTIQTHPSNVIASIPVQEAVFNTGAMGPELSNFADAIEQIMAEDIVIAGTGQQTFDPGGLTQDNVAFTVEYTPPGASSTSITADTLVPVASLNFSDAEIGLTLLEEVRAQINVVWTNLKNSAGG